MAKRIPHVKAGDPITADLYNAVAERLERFLNLRSGSPYVRIWETPTGKAIALALPEPTYALLSGSSSPYSFTEVRDGPGGTWVSMPNGDSGTSNVWECNNKSGLGGKVVPIEWTSAGDWRFQWVGHGPPSCTGRGNNLCLTLIGCSSQGVPGANVDFILGGSTVHSGTTDATGKACLFEPAPGSYTINWSIPGTIFSGTRSATITSACLSNGVTEFLNPPGTYGCRCCPIPVPPLFITDEAGTRPIGECFTYNGYLITTFLGFLCSPKPPTFWVFVSFRTSGTCPLTDCCTSGVYCAQTDPVELTSCNPFYYEGTYPASSNNCVLFTPPSMALPLSGGYAVHT